MSTKYPKYEKYSKYQEKKKETYYERFVAFLKNSKRVLSIANKPNGKEYWMVFKICGAGIVFLGVLSYVIQLIFSVAIPLGD
ncbi:MAG: protein translocase SEC61 complex subunit gamma [Promethearchaeota archaeon]|nr:MAG: protein translocase SEC61 complex subunit gamma [Candidatus Lokiarchaeota archaeon]